MNYSDGPTPLLYAKKIANGTLRDENHDTTQQMNASINQSINQSLKQRNDESMYAKDEYIYFREST